MQLSAPSGVVLPSAFLDSTLLAPPLSGRGGEHLVDHPLGKWPPNFSNTKGHNLPATWLATLETTVSGLHLASPSGWPLHSPPRRSASST
ncbi:hypothetical protein LIER_42658 [Lithospermum erythrorhizon]|uniref:Uncharacterized protein n=1 Tax=Lithospermum erythrorhizon TaxID=34254 RepID=A0AAV3NTF4_LITER